MLLRKKKGEFEEIMQFTISSTPKYEMVTWKQINKSINPQSWLKPLNGKQNRI